MQEGSINRREAAVSHRMPRALATGEAARGKEKTTSGALRGTVARHHLDLGFLSPELSENTLLRWQPSCGNLLRQP